MSKHFFSIILMIALFATVLSSCKDDDIPIFSVTFDSKGGTPTPSTQIVEKGGKVKKPADPTRPNYYFAGWSMEDNATGWLWDFEKGMVTYDIRLYAKWTQNRFTVTVSSDKNGTASANVTMAIEGETITITATASSDYRFAEWQVIEGGITLSGTTDNPATFIMPDEAVEVKALFIPVKRAPIKIWQTYSAFPDGIHEWDEFEYEYTVTRLPDLPMRSGYGYTDGNNLIFLNSATWYYYQYRNNYTAYELVNCSLLKFQSLTHEFFFRNGYVFACLLSDETNYKRIQIAENSFVYTYAQHKNDVIAITNLGEILIFRDNEWYRMTLVRDDIYVITPGADMQLQHSGRQFYSSIIYQDRTLLGEFPTGRIFEFVGSVLQVSDLSPPEELLSIGQEFMPNGKEAQSMAIYGGDLFVGYWPDGKILRYCYKTKSWSQFSRFFTFPNPGDNIHDYYRPENNIPWSFYGQRVTALIPFEDGLYAVTSNLREWYEDIVPSPLLSEEEIRQYGAVYKIYRPGCKTTYFPR